METTLSIISIAALALTSVLGSWKNNIKSQQDDIRPLIKNVESIFDHSDFIFDHFFKELKGYHLKTRQYKDVNFSKNELGISRGSYCKLVLQDIYDNSGNIGQVGNLNDFLDAIKKNKQSKAEKQKKQLEAKTKTTENNLKEARQLYKKQLLRKDILRKIQHKCLCTMYRYDINNNMIITNE